MTHISREDTRPYKHFKVPVWALRKAKAIVHVLARDQDEADAVAPDVAADDMLPSRWKAGEFVSRPRVGVTGVALAEYIRRRVDALDSEIAEYGDKARNYVGKDRFWLAATHGIQRILAEGRRDELQGIVNILEHEMGKTLLTEQSDALPVVPQEESSAKE